MNKDREQLLLDRIDTLEERIRQLEEALRGKDDDLPRSIHFTPTERRMLGVLMLREFVTKDTAMAALYRNVAKDEADIKIVDVFVCKLRKKLTPIGVLIETHFGQGFRMAPASKAIVRSLVAGERAAEQEAAA